MCVKLIAPEILFLSKKLEIDFEILIDGINSLDIPAEVKEELRCIFLHSANKPYIVPTLQRVRDYKSNN